MARKILKPSAFLLPCPIGLITTQGEDKPNIITLAWLGMIVSEPPMVSISVRPTRFSSKLLKESGEFVINIPNADDIKKVDFCGVASGKTTDKFKACNFTYKQAVQVKAPIILECPVNIECEVKQALHFGTHDIFLAEIVACQVNEDILDEKGNWLIKRINPLVYCPPSHEYWTLSETVGSYGFSRGKIEE